MGLSAQIVLETRCITVLLRGQSGVLSAGLSVCRIARGFLSGGCQGIKGIWVYNIFRFKRRIRHKGN